MPISPTIIRSAACKTKKKSPPARTETASLDRVRYCQVGHPSTSMASDVAIWGSSTSSGGAPACAFPTVVRSHTCDWFALVLLVAADVLLNAVEPFHRFVGAGMMEDLRYPLKSNTVPIWAVPVYGAAANKPLISLSFAGLGFLSWYLAGKITVFDRRGHVAKLCVVLVPLLAAAMIAISRVDDYWHHWQDVCAGGVLGWRFSNLTQTIALTRRFGHCSETLIPLDRCSLVLMGLSCSCRIGGCFSLLPPVLPSSVRRERVLAARALQVHQRAGAEPNAATYRIGCAHHEPRTGRVGSRSGKISRSMIEQVLRASSRINGVQKSP
ncbi:hypothetical protein HU200_047270 [Digitaria exilis]|uniref:Phosphatidic acid phosphatase type 2/haloperoxidase domain-containing protein n=1 Tax=Digitaria exilis TaxID=1010633 RepID=A0A835AWV8_9POAL|nr:hypothetical protein HU200_047270 [Digitaria exilis]